MSMEFYMNQFSLFWHILFFKCTSCNSLTLFLFAVKSNNQILLLVIIDLIKEKFLIQLMKKAFQYSIFFMWGGVLSKANLDGTLSTHVMTAIEHWTSAADTYFIPLFLPHPSLSLALMSAGPHLEMRWRYN